MLCLDKIPLLEAKLPTIQKKTHSRTLTIVYCVHAHATETLHNL